jgi:hypothetical protein
MIFISGLLIVSATAQVFLEKIIMFNVPTMISQRYIFERGSGSGVISGDIFGRANSLTMVREKTTSYLQKPVRVMTETISYTNFDCGTARFCHA